MGRSPDPEAQEQLGSAIRRCRETLGLSQAELARKVGVTRQATVSDWETGRRMPKLQHITALARALKIDAIHLVSLLED